MLLACIVKLALGFLGGSAGKGSACSVGDLGSTPALRRSSGEGNSYLLQYSGLEMDKEIAKKWT